MLKVFSILSIFIFSAHSWASDPYESLVNLKFENGLEVYLAPSPTAKLTKIKIEVDVGWEVENKKNFGVSHLLEHVLFRDKELKDNMSYLQLIKEKGGEVNGMTSDRMTTYYATIPHEKAEWLHEIFYKMLTQQGELLDTFVQKEKETVLREIGDPMALNRVLGFDLWNVVKLKYLTLPKFWESEFGVSFENRFTREQERLSTLNITQPQVAQHYKDYYYPRNMRVYVSGRFPLDKTKDRLQATWGQLEDRTGKKLKPLKDAKPSKSPYYKIKVASQDPYISIGTKVWDLNFEDELILETYLEYLSHRLMKEIRNKHGYTYHVSPDLSIYKKYGYASIGFYTKAEEFEDNKALLKDFIKKEAENGGLTAAQVDEAKKLRMRYYEATDNDAESMMWVADDAYGIKKIYGIEESPYAILKGINSNDFNDSLKKYFKPKRRYAFFEKPPLFFKYDFILLYLFVFAVAFRKYRKWLTQKFDHTELKWVRKIQFPPFKLTEIGATFIAFVLYAHVEFVLQYGFSKLVFLQASLLATQYIFWSVCVAIGALAIQGVYAVVPRKLMIVGDDLFIKSMTYFSKRIPLNDIEAVKTKTILTFPFPINFWSKVKWRFYYGDPFVWRKALAIKLKSGPIYIFSFRDSEKVCKELQSFLPSTHEEEREKESA